jgi:hypothetical protein
MSDDQQMLNEVVADLMKLVEKWEQAAENADRAAALAYRRAAADLRTYVTGDLPTDASNETAFQVVPMSEVEQMLTLVGVRPKRLFADKDHTFSAIFARLPVVPLEDRINKLNTLPGLQIIESGTLMETGEPFIDFGFTNEPS